MTARKVSMRRGLRVTGLALLAAATLEPSATAEEQFQKLTGGQIRAKLAGMELTDNVHWRDLYQRNGTVMTTQMGSNTTHTWRVDTTQLCPPFEKDTNQNNYDARVQGRAEH